MRARFLLLSLGTGVALIATLARADIPPDPDSADAHCTLAEQCSAGVFCDYAWRPGAKDGEAEKVGEGCRIEAVAKGLELRCRNGGNYSGQNLYCPKGATGTWSAGGGTPTPTPTPTPEPVKPVTPEPVKSEPVKPGPVQSEPVKSGGCSLHAEASPAWLLLGLFGLLRRRR
ncbi:MAG: hypothetical protein IPO88_18515 [Nannocystis sp.]|uniref:MYXO-CTERM sorting domain-containing protein n=1 Tax=Nannocystis sp. TaxID=1962667 RepID=UPI00242386D1|nr:MYXO-CTERM sorting domain-containing protein [Nannocystis sp.]MBK9755461.1 hypothetical protein [Nannocystis sp.]